jgi:hypothetical protein
LTFLALWGCVTRGVPPALPDDVVSEVSPARVVAPAGEVRDGVYLDARGVGVPLAEGWTPRVGAASDALRIVQVGPPDTGARAGELRLEVWAYAPREGADALAPRPRPGCAWSFRDTGPYGSAATASGARPGAGAVATCTPEGQATTDAPWVLAWAVRCEDTVWHAELVVPPGRMGEGLDAARPVVAGLMCVDAARRVDTGRAGQ